MNMRPCARRASVSASSRQNVRDEPSADTTVTVTSPNPSSGWRGPTWGAIDPRVPGAAAGGGSDREQATATVSARTSAATARPRRRTANSGGLRGAAVQAEGLGLVVGEVVALGVRREPARADVVGERADGPDGLALEVGVA